MFSIQRDPERRGGYLLRAECVMPSPLEEVFDFFSRAENLEELTPPSLKFRILTLPPIEMHEGLEIDYRIWIKHVVPMRWRSKITRWSPGEGFTDEQLVGPYRWWEHDHDFESVDAGTRMVDFVRYGVPLGPIVHQTLVRPDLKSIFAYRLKKQRELFGLVEEAAA